MSFDRITVDPEQLGGRPAIRGLRISVGTMVGLVAAGLSVDEILADHPDLERADIPQAPEYAAAATEVHVYPLREPVEDDLAQAHDSRGSTGVLAYEDSETPTGGVTTVGVTVDHAIMGGVPCVQGTRIPIATVVRLLARGRSVARVLDEYPTLSQAEILAALRFAADAVNQRELPLRSDR